MTASPRDARHGTAQGTAAAADELPLRVSTLEIRLRSRPWQPPVVGVAAGLGVELLPVAGVLMAPLIAERGAGGGDPAPGDAAG